MSIEFKVANVETSSERFAVEPASTALGQLWGETIVAEAEVPQLLKLESRFRTHAFIGAVAKAFGEHLPLVLTPDAIWLLILQAVAHTIAQDPEQWRASTVRHQEKITLEVEADELWEQGTDIELWRRALEGFAAQMRPHLAPPLLALDTHFSTSTPTTRAALSVTLLDATREFFVLRVVTACGIPWIRLEGTPHDWQLLEARAEKLSDFGLHWWLDSLRPILRELTQTANGQVNTPFWCSIFNRDNESGGPILSGWLIRFFPYVFSAENANWRQLKPKTTTIERNDSLNGQIGAEQVNLWSLPNGFSSVPFEWSRGEDLKAMELLGGFGGITQEESGALRPALSWGVREAPTPAV